MANPFHGTNRSHLGVEYCAVHWPGDEGNLRWRTEVAPEVHVLKPTTDWDAIDWYRLNPAALQNLRINWPANAAILVNCIARPGQRLPRPSQFSRFGDYEGFVGLWTSTTPQSPNSDWYNVMLLFRTYEIVWRNIKIRNMFDPVSMSEQYPFATLVMEYMAKTDTHTYVDAPEDSAYKVWLRCHINTEMGDIVNGFFKAMHVQQHLQNMHNFLMDSHPRPITRYSAHFRISNIGQMRKPLWRFLFDNDWRRMMQEMQSLRIHQLQEVWHEIGVNSNHKHDMPDEVQVVIARFLGPLPLYKFVCSLKPRDFEERQFNLMSSVYVEKLVQNGVLKLLAL